MIVYMIDSCDALQAHWSLLLTRPTLVALYKANTDLHSWGAFPCVAAMVLLVRPKMMCINAGSENAKGTIDWHHAILAACNGKIDGASVSVSSLCQPHTLPCEKAGTCVAVISSGCHSDLKTRLRTESKDISPRRGHRDKRVVIWVETLYSIIEPWGCECSDITQ